jgi:Flagellar biosynthesis protein, FliO
MDTARQILGVGFVLSLLAGAYWALRRGITPLRGLLANTRLGRRESLRVVERVSLTPQHSAHILRAGAREWVLITHPRGCTVIGRVQPGALSRTAPAEAAA